MRTSSPTTKTTRKPDRARPAAAPDRREIPIGFYPSDLERAEAIRSHLARIFPGRVTLADAVRYAIQDAAGRINCKPTP